MTPQDLVHPVWLLYYRGYWRSKGSGVQKNLWNNLYVVIIVNKIVKIVVENIENFSKYYVIIV